LKAKGNSLMRFEFDRTTVILVIIVLVVAGIFGVNQLLQSQPPIAVTLVVDPLAEAWAKAAASAYNATNPLVNGTVRVQVQIQVMDDLEVWRGNPNWTSQNHPDAWLASSSLSVSYLSPNIDLTMVHPSLARSPLVWGAFRNRLDVITTTLPFEWDAVQLAAEGQRWQNLGVANDPANVNMAIAWPSNSMAGIGALMSAAAAYGDSPTFDRNLLISPEFTTWWQPIKDAVLNSERLGENPAETMASRGTSAADFALLPEVLWLQAVEGFDNANFVLAYPEYNFVLDFPYSVWNDSQTDANKKAAAEAFGLFLAGEQGQALAVANGLRPITLEPTSSASVFNAGAPLGILLAPSYGTPMAAPSRSLVDALLDLVN
jgi:hypothetical protein